MIAQPDMTHQAELEAAISVAAFEPRSVVNGPGTRAVLWVQGCPFRCPGCINEDFLEFRSRRLHTVGELAGWITNIDGIEGVTYSGGEPMSQPRGLWSLSRLVRDAGLSVFCYTGYTLEELRGAANPWIARLLGLVDVLVDGRYEQDRRSNRAWRGSDNQRLHFLSDRYQPPENDAEEAGSSVELLCGPEGFTATGVLDREFLARLRQNLRRGPTALPGTRARADEADGRQAPHR